MAKTLRIRFISLLLLSAFLFSAFGQQSVARKWNEALLEAVRKDFARPPVHARNLFHISMAMYDAWAAYDTIARTYLLGKTVGTYSCTFSGVPIPSDLAAARDEAVSYAAYRLILNRFANSPNAFLTYTNANTLMASLGYDPSNSSVDYTSGDPAALGNYVAQCVIQMGMQDGSNQMFNYTNQYYAPVNTPLVMAQPGDPNLTDPNRWQPLTLTIAVDQNGNPIPSTQVAQSPEWGNVVPFALTPNDAVIHVRDGHEWKVYHDPGPFPTLDTIDGGQNTEEYKWNFSLVTAWSAQLDHTDGVMWDISPGSIGNTPPFPQTLADYHNFYDFTNGGDHSQGRPLNPKTGMPYPQQIVPRGDYTRVLSQFWADGPTSETPPGHWFAILNYVTDQPSFVRKYNGKGPVLDNLEYDVKAYLSLGGAVHDAAISAWGIKGWYDGVRPVSALRYMADHGQSSDPNGPNFSAAGIPLVAGLIEQVQMGDPLAGDNNENVGKIKFYCWRGPNTITDPVNQYAGVGWILAENWWPYQRKTFVTPPFPGYISGHSTYSRAASETLTLLTGDEYFPGGMGEFHVAANSGFLGLEKGPSVDVTLQWATYRDASDQCSLSRIWGGIHPPMDDIPGRVIGAQAGVAAFNLARTYFYKDNDSDGFYSYEDCDDNNATVHPGASELCDGLDNNCNGSVDDSIPFFTYFADTDGDGYGVTTATTSSCLGIAPVGYASNDTDCNDNDTAFNPGAPELCDNADNNCNGQIDDGIPYYTYFSDSDGDGFGFTAITISTCNVTAPTGYVANFSDCDDTNNSINPNAQEICDEIDNNCNGIIDDGLPTFSFYADVDDDGYGNVAQSVITCLNTPPPTYVENALDCNDNNSAINPGALEVCDGVDNNCSGIADENLIVYTYFPDADGDGFGNGSAPLDTCIAQAPAGYILNNEDCNDNNAAINPDATEILDGLDNDCNGLVDDVSGTEQVLNGFKIYPNPVSDVLVIEQQSLTSLHMSYRLVNASGQIVIAGILDFQGNQSSLDMSGFAQGIYFLQVKEQDASSAFYVKIVKVNL